MKYMACKLPFFCAKSGKVVGNYGWTAPVRSNPLLTIYFDFFHFNFFCSSSILPMFLFAPSNLYISNTESFIHQPRVKGQKQQPRVISNTESFIKRLFEELRLLFFFFIWQLCIYYLTFSKSQSIIHFGSYIWWYYINMLLLTFGL